ncbi:MAG: folylpolyglutamate synthase/dihydrofolate synthase family protein [Ferruginibacter sp.]|nr:bifunctional folylpolyglutamate synthase/dihydrofolate synthase [Ferruginibacter sp.]
MTYQQTLNYLYDRLPMFSKIGAAAYKADLHNTIALCNAIGNPQQKIKTIHIAGTNGKGSTAHMLAAILQCAGYKTGLYTSPHIKDFRERIKVNGQMILEQAVIDFVKKTKNITAEISPSFFELTVAMAFDYFENQNCDIVVVETGLGGLLDSTNIITPILSIITNIGYDHQNILGNTLQEIAMQKAGIIKQNVPVVIGDTLPETKQIFIDIANSKNADLFFANELFTPSGIAYEGNVLVVDVHNVMTCKTEKYKLGLIGLYQSKNICTVLESVEQLKNIGINITNTALSQGLQEVKKITGLQGRWEILQQNPTIILDVAHNKDGIGQVLYQLETEYSYSNLHFILGFVKDKDVAETLKLFPKNAKYYFTNAHIARAMPVNDLKQIALLAGLDGDAFDNVNDALANAKVNVATNDVIMICGSFFVIGEIDNI